MLQTIDFNLTYTGLFDLNIDKKDSNSLQITKWLYLSRVIYSKCSFNACKITFTAPSPDPKNVYQSQLFCHQLLLFLHSQVTAA